MVDLVRQEIVRGAGTVVVKLGTRVLTHGDGTLDLPHLAHLAEQIAELRQQGRQVVVVSSGAIGAGLGRLKMPRRPSALPELQAAAAVGQCDLIRAYDVCFRQQGFHAAQILLTAEDFDDRTRYLNVRNTLRQLLAWDAVPIINENDSVSVAEIRFGDNDRLAALVTNLLRAPLLIILSVADGLYPDGASVGKIQGRPLDVVWDIDATVLAMAGESTSGLGTGGMRSKLESARLVTASGESVWIANGRDRDVLRRIFRAESLGTLLPAKGRSRQARKRWIGYAKRPRGSYVVDDGAMEALCHKGRSLLPVGVIAVHGHFRQGDVVRLQTRSGREFARGLTNYSAEEAKKIIGQPTRKLAEILPGCRYDEVVHRDNLVLL
jgi:glutamate 5-kinase